MTYPRSILPYPGYLCESAPGPLVLDSAQRIHTNAMEVALANA